MKQTKLKQSELTLQEQKEVREGGFLRTAKCPLGSNKEEVSCVTTTNDWEILYSHGGTVVNGIRCENVYAYCDGHEHIGGSGTGGSGTGGSGTGGSGTGGSGTDDSGTSGSGTGGSGTGDSGTGGSGTGGSGTGGSGSNRNHSFDSLSDDIKLL